MKNGDIKSDEKDSPKTPGGISKSHLTSIRRLGLSRKWKKSGSSPFISPLASNNISKPEDNLQEETKARKRKLNLDDENTQHSPINEVKNEVNDVATPPACKEVPHTNDSTPIRKTARKKSRMMYKDEESSITLKTNKEENIINVNVSNSFEPKQSRPDIILTHNSIELADIVDKNEETTENIPIFKTKLKEIASINDNETKSNEQPNKLVKKCIVVIQNKILRKKGNNTVKIPEVLCDSDNEDVPLSHFNKTKENNGNDSNNDTKNSTKVQPIKKTKSIGSKKISTAKQKNKKEINECIKLSQSSNSFSDDDDFELNRKIIFFPKNNDKIVKPVKAKSTGSISQKDIDELKARIEMKKQLLLTKAQSKETEEVRGLIRKWRKGCQDALMELLELMKKKLPDRSDMNYANILEMLKIPPSYVGYDADNDCFSTPDDNSILTSIFSDL